MSEQNLSVNFPEKLRFLFLPKRYKVAYGGRGSGKSYNFAQALILQATQKPLRVLCAREIQKSIKQSVHLLLSDQIQRLGLGAFFEILETEIRGINGSTFMFAGLAQHTVESIKSIEGVEICWVEEAQTVSKKSWEILIPTIRKTGSEIWISFNPDLDTDDTYVRFVLNPPEESYVVAVNYSDNPYFPEELEKERLHCQRTQPEDYLTVWEGKCRSAVSGAIYAKEIELATAEKRICNVPYDPILKVHSVWDLGFNDSMSIILVQKLRSEIRIIESIEESGKTLDYYAALLNGKHYNWGYDFIPHDGMARDFKTGKTTEEILKTFGRKVKVTPQIGIEAGIKAARMIFNQCYFDKTKSARLVECLKRYRRVMNSRTNEFGAPLHDEHSHSCLGGDTMILTARGNIQIRYVVIGDSVYTPFGYANVSFSGQTKIAKKLIEITMEDGAILLATPEHKIFTTKGVFIADTLRYNDYLVTKESAPCLLLQKIKFVGYRDAFIESFKVKNTGYGAIAEFMPVRLAENPAYCILKYIVQFTVNHISEARLNVSMAICATLSLIIGLLKGRCETESMAFKNVTEFVSTLNQMVTTRRILKNTVASRCTDMYGKSTMEKSTKECTFTMSIVINLIMTYQTLSYSLQANIRRIMEKIANGLEVKQTKISLHQLMKKLKHGTQAKKVLNGIKSMVLNHGKIAKSILETATNVVKNTKRHILAGQSSATRIVKLRHLDVSVPVYDLTVDKHHCYIANGILVSNSDAFRYLAVNSDSFINEDRKPVQVANRWTPIDSGAGY